jgi:hypothetical protein
MLVLMLVLVGLIIVGGGRCIGRVCEFLVRSGDRRLLALAGTIVMCLIVRCRNVLLDEIVVMLLIMLRWLRWLRRRRCLLLLRLARLLLAVGHYLLLSLAQTLRST